MWFRKVVDYLILKKKYPSNVIIIKFEDLIHNQKRTLTLLFKKIKEPLKKINFKPTILKKNILGNSSYDFVKDQKIKLQERFKKNNLLKEIDKKIVHSDEYKEIIRYIENIKLK